MLDATRNGNASVPGTPTRRSTGTKSRPPMTNWPHAVRNRSSLVLMRKFQPACRNAEPNAKSVASVTMPPDQVPSVVVAGVHVEARDALACEHLDVAPVVLEGELQLEAVAPQLAHRHLLEVTRD